jgi:SSS family solute:Na+ symporter
MQLIPQDTWKVCVPMSSECAPLLKDTSLSPAVQQDVLNGKVTPQSELHSYNEVLPLMMVRYLGPGLLGLGITALIAGFMSGMAGNVSAFSTVWTYDLYKPLINKKATDSHYVMVGRMSIVIGVLVSIGAGYLVQRAHGIMDYVQALFSIFIAPLLATIMLGMFWKRATRIAGFLGLLLGITFSVSLFMWVHVNPENLKYVALSDAAKTMAENVFRALWACLFTGLVIFVVSMFTKPRPAAELEGLVYGVTPLPKEEPVPFYKNEWTWAVLVMVIFAALNILFW